MCWHSPRNYKMADAVPSIMCRHDRVLERKRHFLPSFFFFSKVMETFSRNLPGTSHFFPSVRMGAHALPNQQLAGRLGQLRCGSGEGVCSEHIYTVRLSLQWRWEGYSYATEYLYHLKSVYWVMLEINERKTYKYPCPHGAYVLMRKTDCKQMTCCWW